MAERQLLRPFRLFNIVFKGNGRCCCLLSLRHGFLTSTPVSLLASSLVNKLAVSAIHAHMAELESIELSVTFSLFEWHCPRGGEALAEGGASACTPAKYSSSKRCMNIYPPPTLRSRIRSAA